MNEIKHTEPIPDLSKSPNPYDFANPVSSKQLFIGREAELKDIQYYLDHAAHADRSINLALLGERAAGKTSLLNIIDIEAADRGLIPVRIDLNESDVETHMMFWFKVFDSIFNRVVEQPNHDDTGNAFGGVDGKTYDTYLDLTSAYVIPQDKQFCPFVFPIQFAKAMIANNPAARVSDQILKRDLDVLAREAGQPLVLLIDECNLLSAHRALLEMVRNTFMNLKGYMLVFTGTPDLFPVMNEVFSPIVRQFKRISVSPFAQIKETCRAVVEPLKSVGQESLFQVPSEEFLRDAKDIEGSLPGDVQDLHRLTGGKPYEIQLVCHFMYKRVQAGKDSNMRLSFAVLEDVLRELQQSHEEDERPVISAVRRLNQVQLKKLQFLLQSGGKVPMDQLCFASYVAMATEKKPEEWATEVDEFSRLGLVSAERGQVSFSGDEFDRIVCKYAAGQRKVSLTFEARSASTIIYFGILKPFMDVISEPDGSDRTVFRLRNLVQVASLHRTSEIPLTRALGAVWESIGSDWKLSQLFQAVPQVAAEMYGPLCSRGFEGRDLSMLQVLINYKDVEYRDYFCLVSPQEDELTTSRLTTQLDIMKERSSSLGGAMHFEFKNLVATTTDEVLTAAIAGDSDIVKSEVFECHANHMFSLYVQRRNPELATKHALLAMRGIEHLDDADCNNVGYVLLRANRSSEAIAVLKSATGRSPDVSLARYNLGLAYLMSGFAPEATEAFEEVIRQEGKNPTDDVGVLLVPYVTGDQVLLSEQWTTSLDADAQLDNICLADVAREALRLV